MKSSKIIILVVILLFAGKSISFLKISATSINKYNACIDKYAESENLFLLNTELINGEDPDLDDLNQGRDFADQKFISLLHKAIFKSTVIKNGNQFSSNISFAKLYCIYRL